jgi:hypothetical protein
MLTWENCVEAQALRTKGWSISAIAAHLGHDRKTIRYAVDGITHPMPTGPLCRGDGGGLCPWR